MWWNGLDSEWGPMYGWWFMPIFGILFLLIVLFIVSRLIGGGGGYCRRQPADCNSGSDELRKEIKALRDEVRELKNMTILK
ncbi:MAG TPA: hypothetical protein VLG72_01300 [Nitrospirota bacterium]|nr:hypothetical protein [Nitrospirota bacterium]